MSVRKERLHFASQQPIASGATLSYVSHIDWMQHTDKNIPGINLEPGSFLFIEDGNVVFKLAISKADSVKLKIKYSINVDLLSSEPNNTTGTSVVVNGTYIYSESHQKIADKAISLEYMYDIKDALKAGDNDIVLEAKNIFLTDVSVEIEEEIYKKLVVKNPTGLIMNIFMRNPDVEESYKSIFVDQIYPHESITVEVDFSRPQSYYFVAARGISTKNDLGYKRGLVDTLECLPDKHMEDEYNIKLQRLDPAVTIPLTVANVSNLELSLEYIDNDINFKRVRLLTAGEEYSGTTFSNQPFVLRDIHSGAIVYFFYASKYGEYTHLDNLLVNKRGKSTQIRFINCADYEVYVNKYGYPGDGFSSVCSLKIGEAYDLSTHTGHVFSTGNHVEELKQWKFIPSSDAFQTFYLIDKSKSIDVNFYNPTNLTLKAYRKINQERHLFGFIPPLDTLFRPTYPDAEWEFIAEIDGIETEVLHNIKTRETGTYNINGNLTRQPGIDGKRKEREVSLNNKSTVDLLYKRKSDSFLLAFTIKGKSIVIAENIGEVLEIRDPVSNYTKIGEILIPPGEGRFECNIEIKSTNSKKASTLTIHNRTKLLLDLVWLDYEGKELKITEITGDNIAKIETYLTHPWYIRDNRSGRVLKRIYGQILNEVVVVDDSSIIPLDVPIDLDANKLSKVKVQVTNTFPFPVDLFLYKITTGLYQTPTKHKEQFIKTLAAGEQFSTSTPSYLPILVKEHFAQTVIDCYIPNHTGEQQFTIQTKLNTNIAAGKIEVFNFSMWDLDILTFNEHSELTLVAKVDTRMSEQIPNGKVGQLYILQEKRSKKVVGTFSGKVAPLTFNYTGLDIRSIDSAAAPGKILAKNSSSYKGNIFWIDPNGVAIDKGSLAANSELPILDTKPGFAYVFKEEVSGVILDQFIIGDEPAELIELNPQLISKTLRHGGDLWPGEVALYTQPNYEGKAYIFHNDLYHVDNKINDKVQSIKLGPGTALTVFQHGRYQGINDVFHLDAPILKETDVKHELSSFQITTVASESTTGISAISRLTEEPFIEKDNGIEKVVYKSVFRTTIQLPPEVAAVDIYASEETSFTIDGIEYKADPVKSAQINLKGKIQLVLTTEAHQMKQAIYMLRASTMKANERFFVFQDSDLFKKIAKLDGGTFVKDRNKLKIKESYSDEQLQGVQMALQNLAATMPSSHSTKSHGLTGDLLVKPNDMEYGNWGLSFEKSANKTPAYFTPLSLDEYKAATTLNDKLTVRKNLDSDVGQFGFFDAIGDFVSDKVSDIGGFFLETVEEVASSAVSGVAKIAEGIADTAQVAVLGSFSAANSIKNSAKSAIEKGASLIEDAVDMTVNQISEAGNFVVEGASGLIDGISKLPSKVIDLASEVVQEAANIGKKVLKAAIALGNELIEFTLDTIDKVKTCMEIIVSKVFAAVSGIIDYLKDLFGLSDIIDTKNILVGYINQGLDLVINKLLPNLEDTVEGFLDTAQDKIASTIDDLIGDFGAGPDTPDEEPSIFDEAKDKISWFLDKFMSDEDTTTSVSGTQELNGADNTGSEQHSELYSIIIELKDRLLEVIKENGQLAANAFLDAMESLMEAVTGKGNPVRQIVSAVLLIVKGIMYIGFGVLKALTAIILKLTRLLVAFIRESLNQPIHIPFISALYKSLTGSELSALDLVSLIIAAPATIICKILMGKPPLQLIKPIGQSEDNPVFPNVLSFFSGSLHLVQMIFEPAVEVKNAYSINNAASNVTTTQTPATPTPATSKIEIGLDAIAMGFSAAAFAFAVLSTFAEEREASITISDNLGKIALVFPLVYLVLDCVPFAIKHKGPAGAAAAVEGFGDGLKIIGSVVGIANLGMVLGQIAADAVDVYNPTAEAKELKNDNSRNTTQFVVRTISSVASVLPPIAKFMFTKLLIGNPKIGWAAVGVGGVITVLGHVVEGGGQIQRGVANDV